jgi:hypothetical protein
MIAIARLQQAYDHRLKLRVFASDENALAATTHSRPSPQTDHRRPRRRNQPDLARQYHDHQTGRYPLFEFDDRSVLANHEVELAVPEQARFVRRR